MTGSYDSYLVTLSIVVAMFASYTALDLAGRVTASQGKNARMWLLGGALAMGTGIWSMHFIGMLAFSLPIPMSYDVPITLLSMIFAVAVSGIALSLVSRAKLGPVHLFGGALSMGVGICLMHYTGMAAMQMSPPIRYDPLLFAASVAIAVVASLVALLIAFRLRSGKSVWLIPARLGSAVIMGFAITGMHYTGMAAARFAPDSICLVGTAVNNNWLAATIGLTTLGILAITLLASIFDARIASRTGKLASSLSIANEELQRLALHDSLTGLPNRALLEDRITQAISQALRAKQSFTLLFIDLDRFKIINDSLGHHIGDLLLKEVAKRMLTCLRASDTVARIGGDEFVVLLHDIGDARNAAAVASKLMGILSESYQLGGHALQISGSIGIALFPNDGESPHALMVNADSAMYHAKKDGRNNYRFFAPGMNGQVLERLELEQGLRCALERNEFELYYQPKVDIKTRQIISMEALIRWNHPEQGMIPPLDFIPLAEEIGLIVPLGWWVIETACRQNKLWQDTGLPRMRVAVNLSAAQFRHENLVENISKLLDETKLDADCLELEVTEDTMMDGVDEIIVKLEQLNQMGVHISIDDFGTGYSSLGYLKRFPIHKLKIDRSFVHDVVNDNSNAAIVQAIISLAHSLKLEVIAEGVETGEELAFLRSIDCDQYQGFFLSPPVPVVRFEALIREHMAHNLAAAA